MREPKVIIVILNWNGLRDTLECLKSVFELSYPNFEVIVVDNGSTDNSVDSIKEAYPRVTLICNDSNLGYTGGSNIGMRYALEHEAQYVWLLNNDTVVECDVLSKLVAKGEESTETGLISPVICYYAAPDRVQFSGSYIDWKNKVVVYPQSQATLEDLRFTNSRDTLLWGTALLIKKRVIETTGYLREEFFAYWEDSEYSVRSSRAGFRNVVDLQAKVFHKTPLHEAGNVKRSAYGYFLLKRNEYLFWMQYLRGFEKVSFCKRYVVRLLESTAYLANCNAHSCVESCLDGAWTGFRGIGGSLDDVVRMPEGLRAMFSFLSSWHPYLWIALLQGNISFIVVEALKRAIQRKNRERDSAET